MPSSAPGARPPGIPAAIDQTARYFRRGGVDYGWYFGLPGIVLVDFWEPKP